MPITFNVKQLLKRHNIKSKDLRGIIELLDDVQKKSMITLCWKSSM